MKRAWKPGDVALVEAGCWANRKVALRLDEGWSHVNGVNVDGDGIVSPVRPLVIIDPSAIPHLSDFDEDAARALSRIADDVAEIADGGLDATEEIIRWLADQMPKPPKPDEPRGLGAVVEDAEGMRWVRTAWQEPWEDAKGWARQYAEINAVRVLSEGVA